MLAATSDDQGLVSILITVMIAAVWVIARIGRAIRRATRNASPARARADNSPNSTMVMASRRAGSKASCWLISAINATPRSSSQV